MIKQAVLFTSLSCLKSWDNDYQEIIKKQYGKIELIRMDLPDQIIILIRAGGTGKEGSCPPQIVTELGVKPDHLITLYYCVPPQIFWAFAGPADVMDRIVNNYFWLWDTFF